MEYDTNELRPAVQQALNVPDRIWYRYTLDKEFSGCALSKDEEQVVVEGAIQTAADMFRSVRKRYGLLAPPALAEVLGLKILPVTGELQTPYLYLGLYDPDLCTITVNENAITLVRQFVEINRLDDLTPVDDILNVTLFHEIFHALEEQTPGIYTRSRMLRRKLLGIFPYRRGLGGVSEVGAVHFSKCMAGIAYSPCIYERYLLLALGRLSIDFLLPNV